MRGMIKPVFDDVDLEEPPLEGELPEEPEVEQGPFAGFDREAFLAEALKGWPGGTPSP